MRDGPARLPRVTAPIDRSVPSEVTAGTFYAGTMRIENQVDAERYVLLEDDAVIGVADYEIVDDQIRILHVEVQPARRGSGLGGAFVQQVLDDVTATTDYRVVPACPFVAHWLREHPDYAELTRR